MLDRMQAKEAKKPRTKKEIWFLYILECNDGSFYTGITKDIDRRLKAHKDGRGASYTRMHRPVEFIYQEKLFSRTQALVREFAVKALTRKQKEKLVNAEFFDRISKSIFALPYFGGASPRSRRNQTQ